MTIGISTRAVAITTACSHYLGRFPTAAEYTSLLACPLDEAGIIDRIKNSDECKRVEVALQRVKARLDSYPAAKKKLLLLGAYGNGNMGDVEMAHVIAQDIEKNHEAVCFAHSPLAVTDYTFITDRKFDASFCSLNPRVLQLFDGLIIGGGGFLACPHHPVWDPAWIYQVPIPLLILAIGAGNPLDARLHNLVAHSFIASGRDDQSVAGLLGAKPDAELCPDPILSLVMPTMPPRQNQNFTRLFVLRGERTAWHDKVAAQMRDNDRVVLFEAKVDAPILAVFPRAKLALTMQEFINEVAEADLVISERYHGAILALLCGRPTIGVYRGDHNASKIVSLFAKLGLDAYCSTAPILSDAIADYPLASVAAQIEDIRKVYAEKASSLIERLLKSNGC